MASVLSRRTLALTAAAALLPKVAHADDEPSDTDSVNGATTTEASIAPAEDVEEEAPVMPAVDPIGTVPQEIVRACARVGRPDLANVMRYLAQKESGYNPFALNKRGPYYGLFQYLWPTWYSARTRMGVAEVTYDSMYDARLQCETTSWKLARGEAGDWGL